MQYANNNRLAQMLRNGGQVTMTSSAFFDLDHDMFQARLADLRHRHPTEDGEYLRDRAAYQCLTMGKPPEGVIPDRKALPMLPHAPSFTRRDRYIAIAMWLVLILLLLATRGHSQSPEGVQKRKDDSPPITVVPLPDSDKVRVYKIEHDQDGLLMQKQSYQLKIDDLDRKIADDQNQLQQTAEDLAKSMHIDVATMTLDLDKLVWITKGAAK